MSLIKISEQQRVNMLIGMSILFFAFMVLKYGNYRVTKPTEPPASQTRTVASDGAAKRSWSVPVSKREEKPVGVHGAMLKTFAQYPDVQKSYQKPALRRQNTWSTMIMRENMIQTKTRKA